MAGFLTATQLAQVDSAYDSLHATFAKTITVYKNSEKTVIQSPSFNSVYGRTNTGQTSVEYTEVSETFEARIYYTDAGEEYEAFQGVQSKIVLPAGSVTIVVTESGYNYLREARRVEFDGKRFTIKSDGAARGLGSQKFFDFLLTPTDE